jgi:CheY-like chemotaxis protein
MCVHKLVIVDDDVPTNRITRFLLEDYPQIENYHFILSGPEALAFLEECQRTDSFPEVILVDLKMPGMDGFEFIEAYESRFWLTFPTTRLMILTSSISEKDRQRARQLPSVSSFITKPLTGEVIEKIATSANNRFQGSADQV